MSSRVLARPAAAAADRLTTGAAAADDAGRPLSVLHVVAPAEAGGLESVVRMLAAGLHGRGHSVRVLTVEEAPLRDGHPFASALQDAGVEVVRLPLPPRAYLRERAAAVELCRRIRPDVVHVHGERPDVVIAGPGRGLGIPTVSTAHGFSGEGLRRILYDALHRAALRRHDAVIAVSPPLLQLLTGRVGVPRERVHYLPNAYDASSAAALGRREARAALGLPPDERVVCWVGRLSPEKGGDVLVDAVAQLADVPFVVSVVGGGPERAALERRAAAHGVAHRFRWHGTVQGAARLYPAFDAFVLSSRSEGMPIALFEAMAAGVPVVASAVGGVPDVVTPAEALLVAPDQPAALAAAIRLTLDEPREAAARAAAARARLATEFAPGPWLARHEALYRTLAAGSRRAKAAASGAAAT